LSVMTVGMTKGRGTAGTSLRAAGSVSFEIL
jgi:hypothetical protein